MGVSFITYTEKINVMPVVTTILIGRCSRSVAVNWGCHSLGLMGNVVGLTNGSAHGLASAMWSEQSHDDK